MRWQARWMTRDFVFTPPASFPDLVAHAPERFTLRPAPAQAEPPALFVLARDAETPLDLDGAFAAVAADLLGLDDAAHWSIEPMHVFGREARRGRMNPSASTAADVAEVTLVRGRGERIWAFGMRSPAKETALTEAAYDALMQSLQERPNSTSAKLLQSQYEGREKKRLAGLEAGGRVEEERFGPADTAWDRRFAVALGENDPATIDRLMADAVALVEEPYGDPVPLGASRIGGGPDPPPDAWPTDKRGMRHPFLMQIDLAEVAVACGPMPPLPKTGLVSFFVHDDALVVDVVHSPPRAVLERHPMTEAIIAASHAAVAIAEDLSPEAQPGRLPNSEGDYVTAEVRADGTLRFAHSPDPVWAYGEPGQTFAALSDDRWACVASARLRPVRIRSFDFGSAEARIERAGVGSLDDLAGTHDAFERAVMGRRAGVDLPQIHQMLGHASFAGARDCRSEAADRARSNGDAALADPQDWLVLVRVKAGSVTGREFWDRLDLTVMAPVADVAVGRWDRCVMLAG